MAEKYTPERFQEIIRVHVSGRVEESLAKVQDAMEDSALEMQMIIETVPSSLKPGKVGRVDTGLMTDSVEIEDLRKVGKNVWRGAIGWVGHTEKYFGYQEYGTGNKSGEGGTKNISPMHALTGARIVLEERVKGI